MSSLGTTKDQQRNASKHRDREPRREEKDTRNAPLMHMRSESEDFRLGGRSSRSQHSEDRGQQSSHFRSDRDGRSGREDYSAYPRSGKSSRPGPGGRMEEHRRPPKGKFPGDQCPPHIRCNASAALLPIYRYLALVQSTCSDVQKELTGLLSKMPWACIPCPGNCMTALQALVCIPMRLSCV